MNDFFNFVKKIFWKLIKVLYYIDIDYVYNLMIY